jgi:creatinine amidohydrolase
MLLTDSTWPEVERYLARSKGILVPVGSTEQHGPNGPIGTDAICAEIVARGVGERGGVLVGPTLTLGMAQHHLGFPGTISLRPTTFVSMIVDTATSLALHSFERIYFLNGHGGNIAPLSTAFSEIYAGRSMRESGGRVRLKATNWYEGKRVRALTDALFGEAEGRHATPSEISLAWFARPDARVDVAISPVAAASGPIRDAADFRERFPDGRMGSDPSRASIDAGRQLYEVAVEDVLEDYLAFLAEA